MPGRSDIKAGAAYVELLLRDSKFVKGLRSASQRLQNFGSGIAKVGAVATAAGGAVLAPFLAATKTFLATGDQLDKMRQRTGISVEALSELSHAAEQSGTSLEEVENGLRRMQRTLGDAANGSSSANKVLQDLGLSISKLDGLSPDEQFQRIAERVGEIEDPTKRAAAAMGFFGKTGTNLLPMIEDLGKLRQEARDLGFTMSGEDAAAAVKLVDMLANLWKTVKFGAIAIGSALEPALSQAVKTIQRIGTAAMRWVKENRQLAVTIAKVAAGVVIAGSVLTGLGLTIAAVGVALGGFASAIGFVGSVLGAVLSPIGLVVAALAGGVFAWVKFTDSGKAAAGAVLTIARNMQQTFLQAFQGIRDALAAGDLALAGRIAMAGLRVVWAQGVAALSTKWNEWKAFVLTVANEASTSIASFFLDAWINIKAGWIEARDFFADLWDEIATGAANAFRRAQNAVGQGLLSVLNSVGILSDETTKTAREILEGDTVGRNAGASAARDRRIGTREAERQQSLSDLNRLREQQQGTLSADSRRRADQIETQAQANAQAAQDDLAAAQAELAALTERAAAARAAQQQDQDARDAALAGAGAGGGGLGGRVASTFSAAAAAAIGQGGSKTERRLDEMKALLGDMKKIADKQLAEMVAGGRLT